MLMLSGSIIVIFYEITSIMYARKLTEIAQGLLEGDYSRYSTNEIKFVKSMAFLNLFYDAWVVFGILNDDWRTTCICIGAITILHIIFKTNIFWQRVDAVFCICLILYNIYSVIEPDIHQLIFKSIINVLHFYLIN